jgi:hypothetical protein
LVFVKLILAFYFPVQEKNNIFTLFFIAFLKTNSLKKMQYKIQLLSGGIFYMNEGGQRISKKTQKEKNKQQT